MNFMELWSVDLRICVTSKIEATPFDCCVNKYYNFKKLQLQNIDVYPQLFFQVIMYFSMIEVGLSAQKWSAPQQWSAQQQWSATPNNGQPGSNCQPRRDGQPC